MDYLFNVELPLPVKLIVAFAVVLVLLALVMWVFKRFAGTRLGTPPARGRQPRLAVIDAAAVDGRRRLVLIRRDNVEHLVMIGGPTDVLIEQNILRAVPVAPQREAPAPRAPMDVPPHRAPPEPIPRGIAEPPPVRALRPEPPPVRAPRHEPPPRRAPDTGRAPAEAPRPLRPAPTPAAEPSLADMAHKLEVALKRPGASREPDPMVRPPALPEPPPPTAPDLNGAPAGGPRAPAPPPAASASSASAAPKAETKATSKLLDSLEEEMASLLNRPDGAPPEKK